MLIEKCNNYNKKIILKILRNRQEFLSLEKLSGKNVTLINV